MYCIKSSDRRYVILLLMSLSFINCQRQILASKDVETAAVPVYPSLPVRGQVIDLDGQPIAGARVETAEGSVLTAADGSFETPVGRGNRWVTAKHESFVSRTRAASPDAPVLLRLTPNPDGEVVSLLFGGDTMFGRRFYDANGDGQTDDGLIQWNRVLESQRALLEGIKPLISNADLTFVNLETPLTAVNPYYPPSAERPLAFHASKQFAFASHVTAAQVLREAGVDLIGLGNNHLFDLKDAGVATTLDTLRGSGFESGTNLFGAGRTEGEAWQGAVLDAKSLGPSSRGSHQKIAFLACTTITGEEHELSYVAGPDKGGAASCSLERIREQIKKAREQDGADAAVFMVHGGYEYERQPTPRVAQFTQAAIDAGATLVINHHPHVVGGLRWNPPPQDAASGPASLIAWSMGNLLFDQNIWQTFESYVLVVQMRRGKIIQAYTEALMLERYLPYGVTGKLADYVAKGAAGRENSDAFVVEDGAAVLDLQKRAQAFDQRLEISESDQNGTIKPIPDGFVAGFEAAEPQSEIRLGRDLLWSGSFEDELVGMPPQRGPLWLFPGFDKEIAPAHAFAGSHGAGLWREKSDDRDVVLTTQHRILAKPGTELSLTGMARSPDPFTIQISWYPDAKGSSALKTLLVSPIPSDNGWHPFRVDAIVPELPAPPPTPLPEPIIESERIKPSVGIFMRLPPSTRGGETRVAFDDIRLIEWAPTGTAFGPLFDHVRVKGKGTLILRDRVLPGAEAWAAPWVPKPR